MDKQALKSGIRETGELAEQEKIEAFFSVEVLMDDYGKPISTVRILAPDRATMEQVDEFRKHVEAIADLLIACLVEPEKSESAG